MRSPTQRWVLAPKKDPGHNVTCFEGRGGKGPRLEDLATEFCSNDIVLQAEEVNDFGIGRIDARVQNLDKKFTFLGLGERNMANDKLAVLVGIQRPAGGWCRAHDF